MATGLASVAVTAGCGVRVERNGSARIDARVKETLDFMYYEYPNTVDLAQKAAGMLVMPLITEAGIGIGGGYGRGALVVDGKTVDYYSTTRANFGIQLGAQQFAHVLFFMTQDSLESFRDSKGWTAGADLEVVAANSGESLAADTNTLRKPIIAIVFGRAGARIGATLEGSKYTRIVP